jgi:hypothetical protein
MQFLRTLTLLSARICEKSILLNDAVRYCCLGKIETLPLTYVSHFCRAVSQAGGGGGGRRPEVRPRFALHYVNICPLLVFIFPIL